MDFDDDAPYEYESDFDGEDDDPDTERDLISSLERLDGAVRSFPLVNGSAALRLAPRALYLEEFLGNDLRHLFVDVFLHRCIDELPPSSSFDTLASLSFDRTAPGMSGSVDLGVLSLPYGLRAYFANDGDGYRLVGGAVPTASDGIDELDASLLSAALDSNGERFRLPLMAATPDGVTLDDRFSFDFWVERLERCFTAAMKYDPDWGVLCELAVLGLEEEVRKRAFTPHVRDGLLAALKHGGVEAIDELPTRTQIALWLERVWLRGN